MAIVSEDTSTAKIEVTKAVLDFLRERRIYQARTGSTGATYTRDYVNRWKPGERIEVSKSAVVERFTTIGRGNNIYGLGSFCSIMSEFPTSTRMGRYCSVAGTIRFIGFRHPIEAVSTSSAVFNRNREFVDGYMREMEARDGGPPPFNRVPTPQPHGGPILLGHDVWIASDVLLTGGISIGTGAVIAAGSLVTKDVPDYAIVGGRPAKVLKYRFSEPIRTALLATRWWEYELADLHRLSLAEPARFLEEFERERHNLRPYPYERTPLWEEMRQIL